ncbi:MAG: signal peptidase II [Chthonomonadaceae bacterium]|nr:signal peptidase II [Chthonomonadaceae bacterium]
MRRGLRLFVLLSIGLLLIDQMVKLWARNAAQGTEGRTLLAVWPGVFELKLVYNQGVAFGMLQGMGLLLSPIAIAIAVSAAIYSWKRPDEPKVHHVTAALLASGAVGNLIDRLTQGHVTDMFWIRLINFPVFNVADVCITAAGVLLVLGAARDMIRPNHESTDQTGTNARGME